MSDHSKRRPRQRRTAEPAVPEAAAMRWETCGDDVCPNPDCQHDVRLTLLDEHGAAIATASLSSEDAVEAAVSLGTLGHAAMVLRRKSTQPRATAPPTSTRRH